METVELNKHAASTVLKSSYAPRKRVRRGKPPCHTRRLQDVVEDCILNNCRVEDLFKQNIYSYEELKPESREEFGEEIEHKVDLRRKHRFAGTDRKLLQFD